jgi:ankyrin repeat protein
MQKQLILFVSLILAIAPSFSMQGMELLAIQKFQPKNNRVIGGIPETHIAQSAQSYIKKILPRIKKFPRSYAALNADLIQTLNNSERLHSEVVLNKVKALVRQGASVNHLTKESCFPPLLYARDVKEVEFLLENGAQKTINHSSLIGTKLHDATSAHDLPMVRLLLAYRAQANAIDKHGTTPLSELLSYHGPGANKEDRDKVQQKIAALLLENGASATINTSYNGMPGVTPLFRTIYAGKEKMSELLLQHNAHLAEHEQDLNNVTSSAEIFQNIAVLLLYYGEAVNATRVRKTVVKIEHNAKFAQEMTKIPTIAQVVSQFIPAVLTDTVSQYLQPLSFDQTVEANQAAANKRVREIQERLAAQAKASSAPSRTPAQKKVTAVTPAAPPADSTTRHPLDTAEEKHDENGEVVPPRGYTSLKLDEQ